VKAYLSRRYRLSASHRLHSPAYTEAKNQDIYGKCNNPHGHGHNYIVEVTFSGAVDPATGMVANLADVDGFMHREIVDRFDHKNLNQQAVFEHLVPTTENLCREIHRIISAGFRHAKLERVRIEETSNNFFEISG
jgi:6-pyruvoyltetrahydropterin/6-carboxytetrahydropterin synthase